MASYLRRAAARWRLRGRLALWYHPEYAPRCLACSGRTPQIVLERVERAVGQMEAEGLLRPGDLRPAPLASFEDLGLVHTPRYLADSLRPETLGRIFALAPDDVDADALLRAQRRGVGGTVEAARAVAAREVRIGFNLGGGFHHAEPDMGGGFCVYNDVAVAVARLRREGFAGQVAVVDLDFHQGNGNLAALGGSPRTLLYSIDGSVWRHDLVPAGWQRVLPAGTGDDAYLEALRESLPAVLEAAVPELVFYVAGNDVLADDPLGGFALTPAGVLARDRLVVETALAAGAGVVVTMGGGYRPDVWLCTANLLRWLLSGAAKAPHLEPEGLRRRYERVAARLDPAALQDVDAPLTEADIMADLQEGSPQRILGFYSLHGVEYALEQYGILGRLREQGFTELRVSGEASDRARQVVRLHAHKPPRPEPLLLVEMVAGRRHVVPPLPMEDGEPLEVLAVEWLLLQDPSAHFSLSRVPLPGQQHPGLGIAEDVQELLVQACRRLGLDGVLSRPAHYHNAAGAADFHFLAPELEGRFLALKRALAGPGVVLGSHLIARGAVRTAAGEVVGWEPADHLLAVSARMHAYFASVEYARRRDAEEAAWIGRALAVDERLPPESLLAPSAPAGT